MASSDVRVEIIDNEADFAPAFEVTAQAFGTQARDGVWMAMNPGWDTPEGKKANAARMASRWRGVTKDRDGNPNTVFLKATVPDPADSSKRVIGGLAIWEQVSNAEGRGVPISGDVPAVIRDMDLASMYPGNEAEQRYLGQAMYSLHKPRLDLVRSIANSDKPAILALDICAVSPDFQRRGIAGKLVQWGLEEAERRGGLEAVMEASSMGRAVYARAGFKQDGPEITYAIDGEFAHRPMPSNIFMRSQLQEA